MTAPTTGVTGATGFIGRRVVMGLRAAGHQVVTLGRAGDRQWDAAAEPPDLLGLDAVVHLAAYLPARYGDPAEAERCLVVNALGTLKLLEAAEAAGVGHVVVLSSGNVYRDTDRPATEEAPAYPRDRASFYLGSKLLAELWTEHYRIRGLPTAVLRPSAVYGPGMSGGVVRIFFDRLSSGQPVVLDNAGQFSSDLVFVDDVVGAIERVLATSTTGIVNVGSGCATRVSELAEALVEVLGCAPSLVEVRPTTGPPTGFAPLDITRLKGLGHVPTALRDGLGSMRAEP